jgi:hypothetical protein
MLPHRMQTLHSQLLLDVPEPMPIDALDATQHNARYALHATLYTRHSCMSPSDLNSGPSCLDCDASLCTNTDAMFW